MGQNGVPSMGSQGTANATLARIFGGGGSAAAGSSSIPGGGGGSSVLNKTLFSDLVGGKLPLTGMLGGGGK